MNKLSLKWHDARRALSLSKYLVAGAAALALGQGAFAQDAKIQVVAAENFYGDVVHRRGRHASRSRKTIAEELQLACRAAPSKSR